MKIIVNTLLALAILPHLVSAIGTEPSDTVVIELTNKSKIVIYTEDREDLEDIENYDINEMIRDLNAALGSKKVKTFELQDSTGHRYLKDTTIIFGDKEAKTSIKVGNLELLLDADDWDDIDDDLWDNDDPVMKYSYEEKEIDRTKNSFNIDLGLTNWMEGGSFPDAQGQDYTVKPWGSWFIGLNSVNKTWIGGPLFLEWGGGISWYNWKMLDSDVMVTRNDSSVLFVQAAPEVNSIKSKLTSTYINVNLVPMLDFARGKKLIKNYEKGGVTFRNYKKQGLRIGLGGYAGYRLGNHSKFVYRAEGGSKEKDKEYGNFFMENFRYGIRAQIGYKGIDLFATYDLNNVFSSNRGPELNAVTFGITL